jgi:hypothetical protein
VKPDQAERRRQAYRRTRRLRPDGELSRGAKPRAEAGRRLERLDPTRSGRGRAGLGWPGARPGVGAAEARIFRMAARSCRVAIRRGRPPQWTYAKGHTPKHQCECPVHEGRPGPGARRGHHPCAVRTCGRRRRRARGPGTYLFQHTMTNRRVRFRPRRHRRQPLQEFPAAPAPPARAPTPTRWRGDRSPPDAPAAGRATSRASVSRASPKAFATHRKSSARKSARASDELIGAI